MSKQYGLVSVPRKFVSDRVLSVVIRIFGNVKPTKQPLRWIMFRELSPREQMEHYGEQEKEMYQPSASSPR